MRESKENLSDSYILNLIRNSTVKNIGLTIEEKRAEILFMQKLKLECKDTEKVCTTCKSVKMKSEFNKNVKFNDQLHFECKSCQSKRSLIVYYDNYEQILLREREKGKIESENLTDYYVKGILRSQGFPVELMSMDLIDFKRAQIILERTIKAVIKAA